MQQKRFDFFSTLSLVEMVSLSLCSTPPYYRRCLPAPDQHSFTAPEQTIESGMAVDTLFCKRGSQAPVDSYLTPVQNPIIRRLSPALVTDLSQQPDVFAKELLSKLTKSCVFA
jgi:hypothetical protein